MQRQASFLAPMADTGAPSLAITEQKLFGAGLKRKHIDFVHAATDQAQVEVPRPYKSVRDSYLSIVLKEGASPKKNDTSGLEVSNDGPSPTSDLAALNKQAVCGICNIPVQTNQATAIATASRPHDLSLAHQVCLRHSYPASHLDRNRQGIKYLTSYGWDPDSRLGLGASGEGVRAPIKAKLKNDTLGLGVIIPEGKRRLKRVELLDAGKVRKKDRQERKKWEKLQEKFYQSEDVERYLDGG
ncbi:MAG: hypothetical protein Q9217_004889 [Psora testacea]